MTTQILHPPTDRELIDLWLHGRGTRTQRAYRADITRLLDFTGVPLGALTLGDLQRFATSLGHLAPASQGRILTGVKSLFAFGAKLGLLPIDTAAPLRLPKRREQLSERILSEGDMHRMLAIETHARNHALLRLLYAGGLRVAEACGLRWRDLQARGDAGQVVVFGKGSKTRVVLLGRETWQELQALRGNAPADAPVFRSKKGGSLDTSQVFRIVKTAAHRAGLPAGVSPHWLRHAHASHALDRGAPISLVQATLGHSSVATTGKYLHARPDQSSASYLPV